MLIAKHACVLFGVGLLAASSVLSGATVGFSGSGVSGTIAPDSLSWLLTPNSRTVNVTLRGVSVWGVPGLGLGDATWPAAVGDAVAFTMSFTGLPSGVSIDQTPDPSPTSFNDFTRFHNANDSIIWTPSYIGTNTVTFNAPTGYSMGAGTLFYVNVAFAGGRVNTVQFSGEWSTVALDIVPGVPEPASVSLVGLAMLAACFARYRTRSISK